MEFPEIEFLGLRVTISKEQFLRPVTCFSVARTNLIYPVWTVKSSLKEKIGNAYFVPTVVWIILGYYTVPPPSVISTLPLPLPPSEDGREETWWDLTPVSALCLGAELCLGRVWDRGGGMCHCSLLLSEGFFFFFLKYVARDRVNRVLLWAILGKLTINFDFHSWVAVFKKNPLLDISILYAVDYLKLGVNCATALFW